MLASGGPERILEMDRWGTRWARENGHLKQVTAPGLAEAMLLHRLPEPGPAVPAHCGARSARWRRFAA